MREKEKEMALGYPALCVCVARSTAGEVDRGLLSQPHLDHKEMGNAICQSNLEGSGGRGNFSAGKSRAYICRSRGQVHQTGLVLSVAGSWHERPRIFLADRAPLTGGVPGTGDTWVIGRECQSIRSQIIGRKPLVGQFSPL